MDGTCIRQSQEREFFSLHKDLKCPAGEDCSYTCAMASSSRIPLEAGEELPDLVADSRVSSIRQPLVSLPSSATAASSGPGPCGWLELSLPSGCRNRWDEVPWSSPREIAGAWSWCVAPPPVPGLVVAPGGPMKARLEVRPNHRPWDALPPASELGMSVAPRCGWKSWLRETVPNMSP